MRDAVSLEKYFPRLKGAGYLIRSDQADRPNCVGYALGSNLYFDPVGLGGGIGGYFWPHGIATDDSVNSWCELFALFDFARCEDGALQDGIEKIAIYADANGEAAHVARQLPSGAWTSKLGFLEDIEHDSLEALVGDDYATVSVYMRRRRR